MRRLLAIALLMLLGLPFAASVLALAPASEANLPMCCRRGGVHHCSAGMQMPGGEPGFAVATTRCPYPAAHPGRLGGGELAGLLPGSESAGGLVFGDVVTSATATERGVQRDSANPKRGPPVA